MKARFSSEMYTSNRCSYEAVACASAPILPLLDTALLLAVSISILVRIILL